MQTDLTFFTNEPSSTLLDRFRKTLKDVQLFDILVGYFRTSGFYNLYESFETIDKVRILVGLNVDRKAFEIIDSHRFQGSLDFESHKRTKEIFSDSVTAEMDHSPDNFETELGVKKFIEFLQSGKMVIKAYPSGNLHAKVYISRFGEDDRDFGRVTRMLLAGEATPKVVIDFGDLPIFDATTYPSILLVENVVGAGSKPALSFDHEQRSGRVTDPPLQDKTFLAATFTDAAQLERLEETLANVGFTMPISALRTEGWNLERPEIMALMEKLRKVGTPLGEYVQRKFYYGIKTGLNEAFVIDEATRKQLIAEDPKSAELIKPWLRGRDVRKWKAEWAGLYIIAIASSGNKEWPWSKEKTETTARPLFEQAYPAIHRHLSQHEDKLRIRDDQGKFWWELRACAYWEEFEKPKISWSHFATIPEFVYDEKGFLSNDKSYIMPTDDLSVLGILNSKTTNFFLGQLSPPVRGGFMELRKIYLEQLPIPPTTDTQKAPIIERVQKILANPDCPAAPQLEAEIDRLVYALYGLTEEEIALVEGKV